MLSTPTTCDLINEVRDYITSDEFDENSIRNSRPYGRIRKHLSKELDDKIRKKKGITIAVGGGGHITANTFLKERIEQVLAQLENDWELI